MAARTVWTGLVALLTVSLGSALSWFSGSSFSWGRWLLICVYAAAVVVIQGAYRYEPGTHGAGRRPDAVGRRWIVLVTIVSGGIGLIGPGLLWYLEGEWRAFVIGGPAMVGFAIASALLRPGSLRQSAQDRTTAIRLRSAARLVIDLLLLALVFPLVGFAAGGAPFSLHPWITHAALVVPSLAFLLAIRPTAPAGPELRYGGRRIRLMTLGLVLCGLAGVVIAGSLLPGSSELRLLAISPAVVVAFTAPAALLHPSPEDGRRLAEILVPVSYLSMIAGLVLLYAMA